MLNIEVKQGYKYTEKFGYIPEDWEVRTIKEFASIQTGTKNTEDKIDNGLYPFFVRSQTIEYINDYAYDEEAVLTAGDGVGVGKVFHYINGKFNVHQRVYKISDFKDIIGKYFYLYFKNNFFNEVKKYTAKSSVDSVRLEMIADMNVLVPTIKEQEKIAEALGDIDSLIDKTQQLINKKKDLKTATMQKLFKISSTTKTDILKNIANIQRGASPRPIDSPIWFDRNSNIGWTRISDIKGKYIYLTEQKLSQLGVQNSRYVPVGSLIMSICATLGRPAITRTELCIHDGFVCFYDIKIAPEYVYYYLQYIQENWKNSGQIGSQANLNTDLINNTLIPLLDDQKQIITILSDMDLEIEALEKELNKYKDLKTGMMQQLLTGKIRLIDKEIQADNKVVDIKPVKLQNKANDEFKDAVIISMLAYKFGSAKYPLGAFRRQKLSYLFKRHSNMPIDEYMKKAMGPYNPKMKYRGAESIAIRNKYVKKVGSRGLVATNTISKAEDYYNRYFKPEVLDWLDKNFHYESNNNLEVLATVDYAIIDLKNQNKEITIENIKAYIANDEEWKPKLKLDYFTDNAIQKAMVKSKTLLNSY